jgi:tetratricopeptide (TPR) repeat protein
MEIMKNKGVLISLTVLLMMLLSLDGTAQTNYKTIQNAFDNSYWMEGKGDYTNAAKAIKDIYDENSYEINLRLGWLTYECGQYTESMSYYQKAMNLKPYSIEAKFGYVYPVSAMGNWDQVISQYQEILKIDPKNTLAGYRMGMIYYGRQDYTTAEKFFEAVINLWPFDYDSNIMYAWTLYKMGKLREAQVLFNKVLMIRSKDTSAQEGLSLIK